MFRPGGGAFQPELAECSKQQCSLRSRGLALGGAPMATCVGDRINDDSYWKWPFIVDLPIKNGDFP